MKISIITVCFNSVNTLEQTIVSILEQTHRDVEFIVVDGNSKDGTHLIIEKYRQNIHKLIIENDNGIYDAMNKGISLATGEIIGILNSDDLYFDCNVLSRIAQVFEKNEVDAVFGNLLYFNSNNNKIVRIWRSREIDNYFFEKGYTIPHPTLYLKKTVYQKIGYYKTDYKIGADHEFIIRGFKKNNISSFFCNEFFVKMRIGGISTSGFKSLQISHKEVKKAWRDNGLKYPFWLFFTRPYLKIKQLIFIRREI